ncbi:MAG: F0F1 ATP synthase subunit A, partial [Fimbriiglobus sp.]
MALNPLDHVLDHDLVEGLPLTEYQILAVAAAVLVAALYIPLARKIATGLPVRGPVSNFLEMLLLFIRDNVARPNIKDKHNHGHDGHGHDGHPAGDHARHNPHALADKFVPFLWTLFLFILSCNLLGMV